MKPDPLSEYLCDLLTPAQPVQADWDSMLAEAVEPFQQDEVAHYRFSESTLESGKELVTALKAEQLTAHERYCQLLNNLQLLRGLPFSRLRDSVLSSCEAIVNDGNLSPEFWPQTAVVPNRKAVMYD